MTKLPFSINFKRTALGLLADCSQRPSQVEREDKCRKKLKQTYQTRHVHNKDTQIDEVSHRNESHCLHEPHE